MTLVDDAKQQFAEWIAGPFGKEVSYLHGSDDPKTIKIDLKYQQSDTIDSEDGHVRIRRAVLRFLDDADDGILISAMDHRDRFVIGSKTWSVINDPLDDGGGMGEVDIEYVEDRSTHHDNIRRRA